MKDNLPGVRATQRELWRLMCVIEITLLRAYETYADAKTDKERQHATVAIQQARRELRETSENLCCIYCRNVLWIEGENE